MEKNKNSAALTASLWIYRHKSPQATFEFVRRGVLETRHWDNFFKET